MLPSLGLVTAPAASPAATDRVTDAWRVAMWAALYAVFAAAVTRAVVDWDVWWHLRAGQWIVDHGAVPQTDPFSAHGAGRPWLAYSWLFEAAVFLVHRALGLPGLLLLRVTLSFAVLAAIHRLVARREPRFLPALGLVAAALFALLPLLNLRPWLLTILFATATLAVVLDLREGRRSRLAWALPVVYVVWANVHIQFVYGLFFLAVACAGPVIDRLLGRDGAARHAAKAGTRAWWWLVGLSAACAAAPLVNPYGVRIYGLVLELAQQPGPLRLISEMAALDFRGLTDWIVLGLALAAAFVLGRRGAPSSFELLLLAGTAWFAFRSRRDIWFVTLAALAILAAPRRSPSNAFRLTWARLGAIAAATTAALALSVHLRDLSAAGLERGVGERFPAGAAEFVEARELRGPLFNHFDWGGYLMWRLSRLPVSLDGRANLHGDERLDRAARTWEGLRGWEDDPDLCRANLVIAGADAALTSLLRRDERFEAAYEDTVAVVFVRRQQPEQDRARAKAPSDSQSSILSMSSP